jgi:molybdopterin/thiamine biosynthesis adenylyltransferase
MQHLRTTGEIVVVDPKKVSAAIINRCLWFEDSNIGEWKADCLSDKFARAAPGMTIRSFVGTLQQYRLAHPTEYDCLIVGVDSRLARRRLQEEVPREVFDSSTTGVEEVVFHHNLQHLGMACLGCVYYETDGERSFAQHVAEALNVSIKDVDGGFITESTAARIAARYPELQQAELVGKAFDTIFKQLCATQRLKTAEQKQVLAPFAFVSQLAGTITAIELFLRRQAPGRSARFNYWRVSPWRGFNTDLQQNLVPRHDCTICTNDGYRTVAREVWKFA